jgi:hypothetical protein
MRPRQHPAFHRLTVLIAVSLVACDPDRPLGLVPPSLCHRPPGNAREQTSPSVSQLGAADHVALGDDISPCR